MNFDMVEVEVALAKAFYEILKEADRAEVDSENVDWFELEEYFYNKHRSIDAKPFGILSKEAFDTGGEGHGENVYMVFRLVNDDGTFFFKKDGYYASHYGTDWDGPFSQVTPVQKMVTFYE